MTYGDFLRFCRRKAGSATKAEFARKLGYADGDHYVGAENDKSTRKPSLGLLERAAQAAGMNFQDFIQKPKGQRVRRSSEHEKLHSQLQELLDLGGESTDWIAANIRAFHQSYVERREPTPFAAAAAAARRR